MNILSEKIENMIKSFEPLDQDISDTRVELAVKKAQMEIAKKQFEAAETRIQELRSRIRDLDKSYRNCIEDSSIENPICINSKIILDKEKEELEAFKRGEYRDKQDNFEDMSEEYEIILARFNAKSNQYNEALLPMFDLLERLTSLNGQVMDLYREYVKLEGGTGQITWTIPWDELLEKYRSNNPKLVVNWQRLPIKESELLATVNSANTGTELSNIPAIKYAAIPGAKNSGFSGMGSGGKIETAQSSPSPYNQANIIFGDGISGQIVLTLAGACPYFDGIDERSNVDLNELSQLITANLIYSFEIATRRSYTATYNLSSLLQKVEKKAKRGGLFSTSSSHSILHDNYSSDWFSIKFDANSSEFNHTPEEQKQITQTVKEELFDKAIRQFSILNAGTSVPPAVPQYEMSGAANASARLAKCLHLYCQAGSIILGIGNSIWGKSEAVANFHSNNRTWVTEQVNGIQFVSQSGSLAFE